MGARVFVRRAMVPGMRVPVGWTGMRMRVSMLGTGVDVPVAFLVLFMPVRLRIHMLRCLCCSVLFVVFHEGLAESQSADFGAALAGCKIAGVTQRGGLRRLVQHLLDAHGGGFHLLA